MATYTLTINVDQASVSQFSRQDWQLCFACGMSSGRTENYNVVAYTSTVAGTMTISWTDDFAIAGSTSSFNNGATFTASTQQAEIKFGQSYTLPHDWENGTVQNDSTAPPSGFKFINKTSGAAAVVYKKIMGNYAPIYLSLDSPLPPGAEMLTPIEKVRIWFSTGTQTGSMISEFDSTPCDLDFTGTKNVNVSYAKGGVWTTQSN